MLRCPAFAITANSLAPDARVVRDRRVAQVMERTDVALNLGRLQRRMELVCPPLVVELRAAFRVAEYELVVTLERRAAAMLP
jgi:hypothetical protein